MSRAPHVDLRVPRAAQALVIMLHGAGASKEWGFFPWLAEVLYDSGLAACRFTMSAPEDLGRVAQHCQARVALPTFLLAHAEGADVAMDVPNLRGVIVWSAQRAPTVSVPLRQINSAATDAADVSIVTIASADRDFTDRRHLILAADVTARFICAYS